MKKNKIIQTSKLLSLLLRHNPEKADIVIDPEGWTDVDVLLKKISQKFFPIDFAFLKEVVDSNDKQRFAFNADYTKIRANQGHSIPVELNLSSVEPPAILYHGTVEKFIGSIKEHGIRKGNRQYVHLSGDIETAEKVGLRRGKPIILKIDASGMSESGNKFFISENNVWLTEFVPPEFINFKEYYHDKDKL